MLAGVVSSLVGGGRSNIGILSPHKLPKRVCPSTNRHKSIIDKVSNSKKKGKGKGKEVEVEVSESQQSTPKAMSEDQNLTTNNIPTQTSYADYQTARMNMPKFASRV